MKKFVRCCCCKELLNNNLAKPQGNPYVFAINYGGLSGLDSLKKRSSKLRDQAHIPKEFRSNYCLRDTMGTTMLSNFATEAEVAHQLGHVPGSSTTRRYAKFTFAAEQGIVNKAEHGLDSLLKPKIKSYWVDTGSNCLSRHCWYSTQLEMHCFFCAPSLLPWRGAKHARPF